MYYLLCTAQPRRGPVVGTSSVWSRPCYGQWGRNEQPGHYPWSRRKLSCMDPARVTAHTDNVWYRSIFTFTISNESVMAVIHLNMSIHVVPISIMWCVFCSYPVKVVSIRLVEEWRRWAGMAYKSATGDHPFLNKMIWLPVNFNEESLHGNSKHCLKKQSFYFSEQWAPLAVNSCEL